MGLLNKNTFIKIVSVLCSACLILFPVFISFAYVYLPRRVDKFTIFCIMQSNKIEMMEYLKNVSSEYYILLILCMLLVLALCFFLVKNTFVCSDIFRKSAYVFPVIFLFCLIPAFSLYSLNVYYLENLTYFKRIYEREKLNLDKLQAQAEKAIGFHVVVVGESASSEHWGLYGYSRNTNPLLTEIIKQNPNKAVVVKNAYSSEKLTEFALSYALTERNQYNQKPVDKAYSIIDVLNKAGVNTYWISNQGRIQNMMTSFTQIATSAKYSYFLNNTYMVKFGEDRPKDGVILKALKQIDFKDNSVVFIHLEGSHNPYKVRYGKKFQQYKGNNVIDEYDNSILYTDYILASIYKFFKKKADTFTYFSDHGEVPGVDRTMFKTGMFKIPFLVVFKKNIGGGTRFAVNNTEDKPFTNDFIYDTLVGLFNIKTENYNKNFDYSSRFYKFTKDENLLVNSGRNTLADIKKHIFYQQLPLDIFFKSKKLGFHTRNLSAVKNGVRYSENKEVLMEFILKSKKDLSVHIKGKPYLSFDKKQDIIVYANQDKIKEFTFNNQSKVTDLDFIIPNKYIKSDGKLLLKFVIKNPVQPKDVQYWYDLIVYGYIFEKMSITENG